jgi:hypothetical protein
LPWASLVAADKFGLAVKSTLDSHVILAGAEGQFSKLPYVFAVN